MKRIVLSSIMAIALMMPVAAGAVHYAPVADKMEMAENHHSDSHGSCEAKEHKKEAKKQKKNAKKCKKNAKKCKKNCKSCRKSSARTYDEVCKCKVKNCPKRHHDR